MLSQFKHFPCSIVNKMRLHLHFQNCSCSCELDPAQIILNSRQRSLLQRDFQSHKDENTRLQSKKRQADYTRDKKLDFCGGSVSSLELRKFFCEALIVYQWSDFYVFPLLNQVVFLVLNCFYLFLQNQLQMNDKLKEKPALNAPETFKATRCSIIQVYEHFGRVD